MNILSFFALDLLIWAYIIESKIIMFNILSSFSLGGEDGMKYDGDSFSFHVTKVGLF